MKNLPSYAHLWAICILYCLAGAVLAEQQNTSIYSDLDQKHGFYSTYRIWYNYLGKSEKWFRGNAGWYYVTPNDQLFTHGRTYIKTVPGVHDDPAKLTYAYSEIPPESNLRDPQSLALKYGFYYFGNFFHNWGHVGESWVRDNNGVWYFVLKNCSIFRWNSGTRPPRGRLVARAECTENFLSRLTDPDSDPVADLPATVSQITDRNRRHHEMHGGWGPHLRGVMRGLNNELHFVTDRSGSVRNNIGVTFFSLQNSQWNQVGTRTFVGAPQQNSANLLIGEKIHTYAIDYRNKHLQECTFHVRTTLGGCKVILRSGLNQSNYIGASWTPQGPVVWWTTIGYNGGPGTFSYIYKQGSQWKGPIVSHVGGYNGFFYVRAHFYAGKLRLGGSLWTGRFPYGYYAAAMGEIKLGQQLKFNVTLNAKVPGQRLQVVSDFWINPRNGDVHVLAQTSAHGDRDYENLLKRKRILYFYKPGKARWRDHNSPLRFWNYTYRARFSVSDRNLFLIRTSTNGSGIRVLVQPKAGISGAIRWNSAKQFKVPGLIDNFVTSAGIYRESIQTQSTPIRGTDFIFTGHWGNQTDRFLWHVKIDEEAF